MKKAIGFLAIGLTAVACQAPQEDNTIQATFDANCETVRSAIDNFQNEVATFDEYSADFVGSQTNFNPTGDSTSLDELKESRPGWWAMFDAELKTDLRLLPGVNPETNEVDGSVRYYGQWEVTKSATTLLKQQVLSYLYTLRMTLMPMERFFTSKRMVI